MEYRKIIKIEIRDFTREVLDKSWEWLNDPQLKRQVFVPDFDRASQVKWFESLPHRKDYFIKSIWCGEKPIAVFGIRNITQQDGEVFGYIGEKEYWGKTIGVQGVQYLIEYARSIHLESLYAIMLRDNLSSYKLHRRLGFDREKDFEDKMIMRLHLNATGEEVEEKMDSLSMLSV